MDTAIVTHQLAKTFGPRSKEPVHAVVGLDVSVARGDIVAFLGPNGAGKTTAIDMILGLTSPTSGSVEVCGMNPREAVKNEKVSAVLQTGGLLRDITVRETAEVIAAQFRAPAEVDSVLERAGIAEIASRRVSKCSGGEQQRLKFALALIADLELLILDEPTSGMDAIARHAFWRAMRDETHRTVLFATHYLEEAQAFADRIILMSRGRIIADGPTDEIRALTTIRTITCRADEGCRASRRRPLRPLGPRRLTSHVKPVTTPASCRPGLAWGSPAPGSLAGRGDNWGSRPWHRRRGGGVLQYRACPRAISRPGNCGLGPARRGESPTRFRWPDRGPGPALPGNAFGILS
ncbi:MAG: ABC transporter ATP-binding protein [Brooklawnia sp.]|nr:ABC transporter ATP-binding protein [Brooklawnia sp.]